MGQLFGGILRAVATIASTGAAWLPWITVALHLGLVDPGSRACSQEMELVQKASSQLKRFSWDFSRADDRDGDGWPDQWIRYSGVGLPRYVGIEIAPREPELETHFRKLDTRLLKGWETLRSNYPDLPSLPPSTADMVMDRYLRIQLDGGQARVQSSPVEASRLYKYRFSYRVMTRGLRHDTAQAELIFLDAEGTELQSHWTESVGNTNGQWLEIALDMVRPPVGAETMMVRLHVRRSESGQEDIRGTIGFDDIRIEQYPQIQIATDAPLGIYRVGESIDATAKVMGLAADNPQVRFVVRDHRDEIVATRLLRVRPKLEVETERDESSLPVITPGSAAALPNDLLSVDGRPEVSLGAPPRADQEDESGQAFDDDASVRWRLPQLEPGFYRIQASMVGETVSTLATETTVAVIDTLIDRPVDSAFGWTLPEGLSEISPPEAAAWLASLGVGWVKYPCWLEADDTEAVEELATVLSKIQNAGIETIGMLDHPPQSQLSLFSSRGRRNLSAAQLFKDVQTWQPLLEPIIARLSLKVRTWQLGPDRDYSFLGQPRLRESISQINHGLQGFGQPIDVAISWPWTEPQLPHREASWQAVSRSSEPSLGPRELNAFLELSQHNHRSNGPRTWLLIDPISQSAYDRQARLRDLVLRMAAVRSHRVEAAFISNPYHEEHGLLRPDGRPEELLLPWRTTSRLLGDLRNIGSLQFRSGAENMVFSDDERAVLVVWSAEPKEEWIYLGEEIKEVDVWGRVRKLPTEIKDNQPVQQLKIGPVPRFILGADPVLLRFQMSVEINPKKLDSFLGREQAFAVDFRNPTRETMSGQMQLISPESWSVNDPMRNWEALAGRDSTHELKVVLGSTTKIGRHELPIRFLVKTIPPKLITVYRHVDVGPEGLDINVTTRLLENGQLRVRIEFTNRSDRPQSYDCMLFPPGDRQYQRRFIAIQPGETQKREILWTNGRELVGKRMLLRASEQEGPRLLNYPVQVTH